MKVSTDREAKGFVEGAEAVLELLGLSSEKVEAHLVILEEEGVEAGRYLELIIPGRDKTSSLPL